MTKSNRQQRMENFHEFYGNSKEAIKSLHKQDIRKVKKYDDDYKFFVCPGGRVMRCCDTIIEVFYGLSTPFKVQKTLNKNFTVTGKNLNEKGASLVYSLYNSGYCLVAIFPPETDNSQSIEQGIAIEKKINPAKLLKKRTLRKHLNYFNSYMEVKSIQGNPNMIDKYRFWRLKNFKYLIFKKKDIDEKSGKHILAVEDNSIAFKMCKNGFKWVFTIGLGGVITSLILYLLSPSSRFPPSQ